MSDEGTGTNAEKLKREATVQAVFLEMERLMKSMSRNMREGIYITFNRVIYNNVVFGYDNHYYKCNEISCLDSKTK